MRLILFLFFLLINFSLVSAQPFFPGKTAIKIDSLLARTYNYYQEKDSLKVKSTIDLITGELNSLSGAFQYYKGVISLFQSFYVFDRQEQSQYRSQGTTILKDAAALPPDSLAYAFNSLVQLHFNSRRMSEWLAVDKIFRAAITGSNDEKNFSYAVLNYADQKLKEGYYFIAKQLAVYDYYMRLYHNPKDPLEKLNQRHVDWIILKTDLEQWLMLPYDKRFPADYGRQRSWIQAYTIPDDPYHEVLRKMDFRRSFKELISRLQDLKKEMVDANIYGSSSFQPLYRSAYYHLYQTLLIDYYNWAVSEHRESQIILDMREFVFNDILPNEIEAAIKAGKRPAVDPGRYTDLVFKLASLYNEAGNGYEAEATAYAGLDLIITSDFFTIKEQEEGIKTFYKILVSAKRSQNSYTASLEYSRKLKKHEALPDSIEERHLPLWDNYIEASLEEMYTLFLAGQYKQAIDSMKKLLDDTKAIDDGSDNALLYATPAWRHMRYLIAYFMAYKGIWQDDLLKEVLEEMQLKSPQPSFFYQAELAYLLAYWRTNEKVHAGALSNLLFYSGRQLKYNFIMLSAADRMRLYEQKLSPIFDVYHELLFSGKLEKYPAIKEKIIAQSLSLKKALADGNQIPDELLMRTNDSLSQNIVKDVRNLRQETDLLRQNTLFRNKYAWEAKNYQDKIQKYWLKLLEKAGMDSLVQLTEWKNISARLAEGQVYTEIIRYKKWLGDSTAFYGAFVILPGNKLEILNLYPEQNLVTLFRDAAASPQIAGISSAGHRGLIIAEKDTVARRFVKGSPDKLAELILQPLWPYLENKQEWLMVQDGMLNRISFAALQWKSKYLHDYFLLRQLSSSRAIAEKNITLPAKAKILLAGGFDYGEEEQAINPNRLFSRGYNWRYLPGTQSETEKLQKIFSGAGYNVRLLSGNQFPDTAISSLQGFPLIHIASHGFYFDSLAAKKYYSKNWNQEAIAYEPLFRCGIAVSKANYPDSNRNTQTEGYLMGFELANLDLRKCYLVSLSACETGLGDVRNNLGVDGLSRALKLSGARYLLISLWKVPDEPTALFMEQFYQQLFSGKSPAAALRFTQAKMSQLYEAVDWGAFVLVE
ncbi:MAG TPA: CHAT domain-containing protein [Chitinophagaceae bacterium]|nr:CHAT domain-containing protein [Chitinophagaceae bacterium]